MRWSSGNFLQEFYDLNNISNKKWGSETQKGTKSSRNGDRMRGIKGSPSRSTTKVINFINSKIKDESIKRRREKLISWDHLAALARSLRTMNLLRQCTLMTCTKIFFNGLKRKRNSSVKLFLVPVMTERKIVIFSWRHSNRLPLF